MKCVALGTEGLGLEEACSLCAQWGGAALDHGFQAGSLGAQRGAMGGVPVTPLLLSAVLLGLPMPGDCWGGTL